MPWVNKERCNGCGLCVEACPVGAISIQDEKADINMQNCIRCAVCHDVCPEGVVRHDGERIPEEIETNIKKAKNSMDACAKYLGDNGERKKCLKRMINFFNKEKKVVEGTIKELTALSASMK